MKLRDYQARAVGEVREAYRGGGKAVCLVAPTGSGKTVMGLEVVRRVLVRRPDAVVLWMAHRVELVEQAVARGAEHLGETADRFDVATVQTLALGADQRTPQFIVWDEAHHASPKAPHWHRVLSRWPDAWRLGLTATPQRGDGSPLGDCFDRLVVAAQYSELIEAGHLVPCRVFRPEESLGQDLALQPLSAWQQLAEDRQGFAFVGGVPAAIDLADQMCIAGIPAAAVHANTPGDERAAALEAFRRGDLRCLVNVYVFTEGVDVPAAGVCLLARGCGAESTYLQMVGRVLRPSEGKDSALLIDLSGASYKHGMPDEDREYTLDGRGIGSSGGQDRDADEEGAERHGPTIWNMELREVYRGSDTPRAAKRQEYERLLAVCRRKGWLASTPGRAAYWAGRQYEILFGAPPPRRWVPDDLAARAKDDWRQTAAVKGYRAGWAWYRQQQAWG